MYVYTYTHLREKRVCMYECTCMCTCVCEQTLATTPTPLLLILLLAAPNPHCTLTHGRLTPSHSAYIHIHTPHPAHTRIAICNPIPHCKYRKCACVFSVCVHTATRAARIRSRRHHQLCRCHNHLRRFAGCVHTWYAGGGCAWCETRGENARSEKSKRERVGGSEGLTETLRTQMRKNSAEREEAVCECEADTYRGRQRGRERDRL